MAIHGILEPDGVSAATERTGNYPTYKDNSNLGSHCGNKISQDRLRVRQEVESINFRKRKQLDRGAEGHGKSNPNEEEGADISNCGNEAMTCCG